MADELFLPSSNEGSSVDWPTGTEPVNRPLGCGSPSTGSPVDSYDSVVEERSPILFKLLDEVTDEMETVDSPRLGSGVFGASLSTRSKQDGCFCHRLHKEDGAKWSKFGEVQDGDELQYINHMNMCGWSHCEVMETIRHLKGEITFTFFREKKDFERDHIVRTEDLFIELTFHVSDLDSDGKGIAIGDVASHIKDFTIKVVQKISYKSSLNVVSCTGTVKVKIGHGALTQHFLCATQDNVVMEPQTSHQQAYGFLMHSYCVQDCEGKDPNQLECMVAFQSCLNNKFLMCRTASTKLSLLKIDIGDKLKVKAANSPCLFLMTKNGSGDAYLESVAYEGYFLGFDQVDLLELKRFEIPPTSPDYKETDCIRRNYTFHIY